MCYDTTYFMPLQTQLIGQEVKEALQPLEQQVRVNVDDADGYRRVWNECSWM